MLFYIQQANLGTYLPHTLVQIGGRTFFMHFCTPQ